MKELAAIGARSGTTRFTLWCLLAYLCPVQAAFANTYASGHQALQVWDAAAQANLPPAVKLWLLSMAVILLAGLAFVWRKTEARWVVGGFVLGLMTTRVLIPQLEIIKLSGLVSLVHVVFWSPGLILIGVRRPFREWASAYGIWSALAAAVILISFYFDIPDAITYLRHLYAQ